MYDRRIIVVWDLTYCTLHPAGDVRRVLKNLTSYILHPATAVRKVPDDLTSYILPHCRRNHVVLPARNAWLCLNMCYMFGLGAFVTGGANAVQQLTVSLRRNESLYTHIGFLQGFRALVILTVDE